ncbi:MAG TPA: ornithine cyclodeaminase family protein [Ktedonobacteraceae bacterium]|jgi:alanine dehydrogenase|nr:ornithine cyclodeaminase family protein [Ktedonobacteraceae bacterium]
MPEILCLSTSDLRRVLTFEATMEAVQQAYVAHSSKTGQTYPIIREKLSAEAVFGVKAGYLEQGNVLGLKAAGYWKRNRERNEEAHQATVVLIDPETGKPRAFMDGNYITTIRTGAAGAVAARCLAKQDAQVLAVIGTGVQGKIQTEGILKVRPDVRHVRCFGLTGRSVVEYTAQFQGRVEVSVCKSVRETIEGADIIVTATPAIHPLLLREDLKPGVHINAMGADTKGKSELDESVLSVAEIFTDDLRQARTIGELQRNPDRVATEIGDVLLGNHAGRQREEQITVFDSTGIALQDLTTAELALEIALKQGVGSTLYW